MATPGESGPVSEETAAERLQGLLADDVLSLDMVSALAGDRQLTDVEQDWFAAFGRSRGRQYYSDLLYAITHQYFAPESAEPLWDEILQHKRRLAQALNRNVRIVVAALDYLSNITPTMASATLIGEPHIAEIVALSLQDGLTGLFNHTYFLQQIGLEVKRCVRYGTALALAMIDIDDFKKVNDRFGHQEGDRILAAMGATLLQVARDSDICCRYGGEELAVILPLTDRHEAGDIAGRMKTALARCTPGDGSAVTVSIGVAAYGKAVHSARGLVQSADAALYRAKQDGKNRVVVSP